MADRILIVDDEALIRKSLGQMLGHKGYDVVTAASAAEARKVFTAGEFALALLDLRLPDASGIDLLREFKAAQPDLLVIMMTAYGSVETAVEAMRLGAYDYVNKPFKSREIEVIVRLALEARHLKREVKELREEALGATDLGNIVARDPAMLKVLDMVRKVAQNPDVTVLIQGESGTGKEMIARAVHAESPRADKPFVGINCAAIPGNLLESELFGYEKGAFTDAKARKIGLIERAQGGTLFLDEIGDMDVGLQAKLLRVLEERKIRRVGGLDELAVDVRILAATNQDLDEKRKTGRFREDLYYRLKIIHIDIPPLRERKADILPLAQHFIQDANRRFHKNVQGFSPEAEDFLLGYRWPGNVRELKNTIERILILEETDWIRPEHLPPEILRGRPAEEGGVWIPQEVEILRGVSFDRVMDEVARYLIGEALRLAGGNKAQAARLLDMDRGTLRYQIKRLGIGA
ncbi:sigma-54-dependent transcriptional regulator [Deferrisoma camini]|uniref:sigma-54-dependent transcriptional regulator n=1 Tax=Deferrisoma camini TaxID=1035120 RepID=UPI00046D1C0B|nr:sigma-54 dependent transcriptional regulator [Deferrisoma camini]